MEYWSEAQLGSIHKMLNPNSIAVVGATERMQYGGRFLASLLQSKEKVRIYPVNPRYEELMGIKCYPSVSELPESPDLVGVIVPYDRVIPVIEESAQKGAGSAVVISAGFAERGLDDRRDLQVELGALARRTGVRVSGPNCLGLANIKQGVWPASHAPDPDLKSGRIGLVCQSGASAFGPFLSRAIGKGIGYSYIVSTGNEADLETSDFVRYLLDDDDTRAIGMFIEGFKDARKFVEVARLAAERGKPIIAIKIGRSNLGTRAARSHTAALTGTDSAYDAAFEQYGVIRVSDWDEMLEVSQMLAYSPKPAKRGVALVSHSGGVCSLTSDLIGQAGLELPELSDKGRDGINEILQGFGWAANPADITGHIGRETFSPIMEYMIGEPEVGALAVATFGSEAQAQRIIDVKNKYTDKVVAFLCTGNQSQPADGIALLTRAEIPVFYSPSNLACTIKRYLNYHDWREQRLKSGFGDPAPQFTKDQQAAANSLLSTTKDALTESEGKQLLGAWGIASPAEKRVSTAEEAAAAAREIGYPVVLKVESPDILHKTEAGVVRIGIRDEAGLTSAYDEILRNARSYAPSAEITGVLVQEMVTGGTEVIVGVSQDVQLGPVLLFGTGGVTVEVMGDVALRICPITREDAEDMINEVKGSRLLKGFRGQPAGDVRALVDVLVGVSNLAVGLSDRIGEIDINPLMVLPEGKGVKSLDALIALKKQ